MKPDTAHTSKGGLSLQLQVGKAAEHLVCFDLIIRGFSAFLADAGLPYDVLVDTEGKILRVQVKSTRGAYADRGVYRFGLRHGKKYERTNHGAIDVFAFVALDTRTVAYLSETDLTMTDGRIAGLIEFADERTVRRWGKRTFQKYALFPPASDENSKPCFVCGVTKPSDKEHFAVNKKCRRGITGVCRVCYRKINSEKKKKARAI